MKRLLALGTIGLLLCLLVLRWAPAVQSDTSEEFGWLRMEQFGAVSSGTEGLAAMTATSKDFVRGHVWGVHLDYAAGITTTTDVTLSGADPTLTLLSVANNATDGWYYPVVATTLNPAPTETAPSYDRPPINSLITAVVTQTSLITTQNLLTVTVYWGQ